MSSGYEITFVFTEMELAKKVYKNDLDNNKMSKIRYHELPEKNKLTDIKKLISNHTVKGVVIPPLDSFKESAYAYWIYYCSKKYKKKVFYFWGKWEAPTDKQPIKKKLKNSFQRMIVKPIIRHADCTIGYGKKACEYLISNGANAQKCYPAYYSSMSPVCERTNWKQDNNIPTDRICVLYFGRVIEKKGLRVLIDAFGILDEIVNEKIWLVIAGDGPDRDNLQKYASSRGVFNISWLGFIHPDERYNYFSQCSIFVLPTSYYEGSVEAWGMTVNEALQCGNILIATEAVGSAYELINEKNGYIVKAGDPESLSMALADAVLNKDINAVIEEDERIIKTYNYNNSAQHLIGIFEETIAKVDRYER